MAQARDFSKTSTEQLLRSYRFHDNDRGTMTMDEEIRRMSLVEEIGAELQRRKINPSYTGLRGNGHLAGYAPASARWSGRS